VMSACMPDNPVLSEPVIVRMVWFAFIVIDVCRCKGKEYR